ncbi:MAG: PAS domain S-box protein [Trueperaceae bacterium]|nr:PAS domain S-box protein [Trueperaceae bacterium]
MIVGALEICYPHSPLRPSAAVSGKSNRNNNDIDFQTLASQDVLVPSYLVKNLFAHSPAPLLILRLKNRTVIGVNDSLLRLLAYGRQEVLGRHVLELGLFHDPESYIKWEALLLQGQSVEVHEERLQSKCGAQRIVLLNAEPFDFSGERLALISLADISSQKLTEEQLNQAVRSALEEIEPFVKLIMQKLVQVKSKESANDLHSLTDREKEVLELIAKGYSNGHISKTLSLAPHTVRNYVTQIYQKLDLHSRAEAVVWARERGLINGQA